MEFSFVLAFLTVLLPICHSAEIPDIVLSNDVVASLVKRMDAFEAHEKSLIRENEDLWARIKALEDLATSQHQEIKRLTEISKEQVDINKRLAERLTKLEGQSNPEYKVKPNSRAISRMRKSSNEVTVAFFSTLRNHLENPGVHQSIVFENVITNIGNGYNPHAGDFRAPVSGVYVFAVTLMAGSTSTNFHYQIMRNGSAVSKIYITNGGTASQEAVLHLKQGDDVAIHNIDAGHKLYGSSYTTFSGFLLQEDFPEVGLVGK